MTLQATRTIGTGDGWERTDSGIYLPDWADRVPRQEDVVAQPARDRPVRWRWWLLAGVQAGGLARDRGQRVRRRRRSHLSVQPGLAAHPDRLCTPEDEDRWTRRHNRLERYHAHRDRPPLDPGSGWIAGQEGVRPCEVFFFGDVRALTGEQILDELGLQSDDIGCVFGGPPCQGFSKAGRRQPDDPRNELVFEFIRIVCEIHPRSFCMENVPGMLDMSTRDGMPVIDALALMAQQGGMGTFEAIRRSLAETSGVGAALRTMHATAARRQPQPGLAGNGHIDVDDEQLPLFAHS